MELSRMYKPLKIFHRNKSEITRYAAVYACYVPVWFSKKATSTKHQVPKKEYKFLNLNFNRRNEIRRSQDRNPKRLSSNSWVVSFVKGYVAVYACYAPLWFRKKLQAPSIKFQKKNTNF